MNTYIKSVICLSLFICCSPKKDIDTKLTIVYVDTLYGSVRKTGCLINGKREGVFNTYNKNKIEESEMFKNDSISSRFEYYNGYLIISKQYKHNRLVSSWVEDYSNYLEYFKLSQLPYSYDEPDERNGMDIYKAKCNVCHSEIIGSDFYSKYNYSDSALKVFFHSVHLNRINGKINIFPSDTNKHYLFGFMSDNDIKALIKFFHSDRNINLMIDSK